MRTGHMSTACPPTTQLQHARRPNLHSVPAGHTFTLARRPNIYSMPAVQTFTVCPQATHLHMPAGYTFTTCPQAIHLHHAHRPYKQYTRRPRAHSMPAGHTYTACPLAIHTQHARRPIHLQHARRPYTTVCPVYITANRTCIKFAPAGYYYPLPLGHTPDHNLPSGLLIKPARRPNIINLLPVKHIFLET